MTSPRKILFVGGFDLPDENAAAQRVNAISDVLVKRGYCVDLIGLTKSYDMSNKFELVGGFCRYLNLKYPQSTQEWIGYLFGTKRFRRFVSLKDYDVVVCYNFPAIPLILLGIYKHLFGFKLVSDLTEWYDVRSTNFLFRVLKSFDVTVRMRVAPYVSDFLIVVSEYLKNLYPKTTKLLLPTLVPPVSRGQTQTSRENGGPIKFIYAGSPFSSVQKDDVQLKDRIDQVVESFLHLSRKDWVFDIYGITENEYCQYLGKKRSEEFGERIIFHGRVKHRKIEDAFKRSDYSIFFRDDTRANRAGFPTKLSESFSFGVPVVTNDVGDSCKYILNGRGFVLETSKDNYAVFLDKVIEKGQSYSRSLHKNLMDDDPLSLSKWEEDIEKFFHRVILSD